METISNSCKQEIYTIKRHYARARGYGSNVTLNPYKFTIRYNANYIWRENLKRFIEIINRRKRKAAFYNGYIIANSFTELRYLKIKRHDKIEIHLSYTKRNILNNRKLSDKR